MSRLPSGLAGELPITITTPIPGPAASPIARAYSAMATGGSDLGITPRTMAALEAPAVAPTGGENDLVLGMPIKHSLGFGKPNENLKFGSSDHAFGWRGCRVHAGTAETRPSSRLRPVLAGKGRPHLLTTLKQAL